MRQFTAFTRKEITEIFRTGKGWLLAGIFVLFGIMSPAIAKLTPWMMEMYADSLAESGMVLTEVKVDAMTSWGQYYKNVPIALIVFVIMFGGILTTEYQKGTLINMLTKGLARWKVILSKTAAVILCWTVCYWMCYGITYGYTAYFWDNSIASHLVFSAFCIYLLGIWLISLIILMSTLCNSTSAVLGAVGGVFVVVYLASMIPTATKYLPIHLASGLQLVQGSEKMTDFWMAIMITGIWTVIDVIGAVVFFNRKNI